MQHSHPLGPQRLTCVCETCAPDVPLPGPAPVQGEPARFVACGERGAHRRVTDCWVCWSDVHQGLCELIDVLHPDHLDLFTLLEVEAPPQRPGLHVVD